MEVLITILLAILGFILITVGLVGVILPLLPGVPLAWLGLFIYAIGTGFERISVTATIVFFVLTLLTFLLDFLAPMLGAKKHKASKWGLFGVFLGFIVGILVFGFWGIILGPFIGALLGELIAGRAPGSAVKSALGALVGFLFGSLLKIVLILVMLGFFIVSWF